MSADKQGVAYEKFAEGAYAPGHPFHGNQWSSSMLGGQAKTYLRYLRTQIIPDSHAAGRHATAGDLETVAHVLEKGKLPKGAAWKTVGEFRDYLHHTLIPDLREAGSHGYVQDFTDALKHMRGF